MIFNFIIPDLFQQSQKKAVAALGITGVRFDEMHAEFESLANTDIQRRKVERLYADVIPHELPVCVLSERDGKMLCKKYGLPSDNNMTVAAIGLGLDTRYSQVLLLTEEYLDRSSLIHHELIHYRQVVDGHLRYDEGGTVSWTKPGQQVTINCTEDLVKKHSLKTHEELLWHELHKPWELEAYAMSTPSYELWQFSGRCQKLMKDFLARNKSHLCGFNESSHG